VGGELLERSTTLTPALDIRLVIAALDGLGMGVINAGARNPDWLRLAVRRQLRALLG
jgi:hypothetical protein